MLDVFLRHGQPTRKLSSNKLSRFYIIQKRKEVEQKLMIEELFQSACVRTPASNSKQQSSNLKSVSYHLPEEEDISNLTSTIRYRGPASSSSSSSSTAIANTYDYTTAFRRTLSEQQKQYVPYAALPNTLRIYQRQQQQQQQQELIHDCPYEMERMGVISDHSYNLDRFGNYNRYVLVHITLLRILYARCD